MRSHVRALCAHAARAPRPLSAEALVELQVQNAGLRKRLERLELEREVSELSAREKGEVRQHAVPLCVPGAMLTGHARTQENLELQRLQSDLENQVRSRQQDIAALQAELTKRDDEHRTKQTGSGRPFLCCARSMSPQPQCLPG